MMPRISTLDTHPDYLTRVGHSLSKVCLKIQVESGACYAPSFASPERQRELRRCSNGNVANL